MTALNELLDLDQSCQDFTLERLILRRCSTAKATSAQGSEALQFRKARALRDEGVVGCFRLYLCDHWTDLKQTFMEGYHEDMHLCLRLCLVLTVTEQVPRLSPVTVKVIPD